MDVAPWCYEGSLYFPKLMYFWKKKKLWTTFDPRVPLFWKIMFRSFPEIFFLKNFISIFLNCKIDLSNLSNIFGQFFADPAAAAATCSCPSVSIHSLLKYPQVSASGDGDDGGGNDVDSRGDGDDKQGFNTSLPEAQCRCCGQMTRKLANVIQSDT